MNQCIARKVGHACNNIVHYCLLPGKTGHELIKGREILDDLI